ncbi:MAG: alkaline phosphatase [Phycisphaeraceae bacterium]|nr:alkaline phosphatase [Phycisphaeraceae bacterium]
MILCIGDGMGFEHVRAAGIYLNGESGSLSFESFPAQGMLSTGAADDPITDSAASATAMASGRKVSNGVIGVAIPGDGHALPNLLDQAKQSGKLVGLVTTTELTHATPAAFGAHTPSRDRRGVIARGYLHHSRPDVMFGGGGAGLYADDARQAGYTVVTDRDELLCALNAGAMPLCGLFGKGNMPYEHDDNIGDTAVYETLPHLHETAMAAVEALSADPDGFFLMVEGGRIDHAAHDHQLERIIDETIEFSRTVADLAEWARGRDDTLIIVTADHETGGMSLVYPGARGVYPVVRWSTWGHTPVDVGIWATGQGAGLFEGTHDNADLPELINRAGDDR